MKQYVVDVSAAQSWSDFIKAFNDGFIRVIGGGEWNGNLDAFNDYLYWPDEHPYELVLRGWKECAHLLQERRSGNGRPVLEGIEEIFRANEQARIVIA
jgi:hypothetical protein